MLLELYVYVQQNRRDIQECWGKKTRIKGMHASIFFHYLILFSYLEILFIEGVSCMN